MKRIGLFVLIGLIGTFIRYAPCMEISSQSNTLQHTKKAPLLVLPNIKRNTLKIYGLKRIKRRGDIVWVRVINRKFFPFPIRKKHHRHIRQKEIMFLKKTQKGWELNMLEIGP